MTTIAYRDGVMAADTRAYGGDKTPVGWKQKIRLLESGTLIGCSSNTPGQPEAVLAWFERGADQADRPQFGECKFRFIAVRPDGTALLGENSFFLAGPLQGDYFAIGSGEEFALGALFMGATAEQAVRAAAALDVWTGGDVTVLQRPK